LRKNIKERKLKYLDDEFIFTKKINLGINNFAFFRRVQGGVFF
jgi:hypothetical protein